MNRRGLEYKPLKLYLKDIVLNGLPNFTSQTYISVEVKQRGRRDPYVSRGVLTRKGDQTATLSINPPLLLSEDVKFEFFAKPQSFFFGSNQKLQKNFQNNFPVKPNELFHFWLNTFFVDMVLEGGLAHDLTGDDPILRKPTGSQAHVHHASGSSEDSSADDLPLTGARNGHHVTFENNSAFRQTSVPVTDQSKLNAENLSNLIKHASISDEHLLQEKRGRQVRKKMLLKILKRCF